ncbi:solute carrier family 26 protein [Bacillus sp. REN3]|uniref:SulP family inorganic anion transporter n=1 Tax=Bacillus sp. REN3 TaxID=2802440 RepID=UPI001AEE3156|nr:solute carrier family 26 protein [Bacillus sp. REN3]
MIRKILPDWLLNYDKSDLRGDLSAGLIVAIMLIPQGMAYAMLAGLPPVIGLYASTIPLIIYALMGSSRQLAVGPVAMVSLLVLTGVSMLAEPGTDEYIALALLLALMVGVFQLAMGLLKLGFLVNFLSHAVITAFTSAAAIIIGLSQLKQLLGIKLENTENVFLLLGEAFTKIGQTNLFTFGIGIASILLLVLVKKKWPKLPGPLFVVLLGSLAVYFFDLEEKGVSIVGEVPKGIPNISLPAFELDALIGLLPIALTITFVGFMESVAVAKAIAAKENYKIDANKELRGLGMANIAGSFFSAYPVTGGFSRSAVNYQSGARTGLASIITAVLILVTLLFFTDLFYYLPNSALAAIIMVAVYGLIDFKEAAHLFKVKKADGFTFVITFIATLTTTIEKGIIIGVVFSLLVFIWRSAYPHVAQLGYIEREDVFRNIKRYPEARTLEDTIIFRIDASLYFANMTFFEDKLRNEVAENPDTKRIILDFSGVNAMDAVAIDALEKVMKEYEDSGIKVMIAGMKGPVMDLIRKAGWEEKYGEAIRFLSINQALDSLKEGMPWQKQSLEPIMKG